MFIRSVKVKRPKVLLGAAAGILALLIILPLVLLAARGKGLVYEAGSEAKRQSFLKEMGWETAKSYDEYRAVTIPEQWNEVYISYNKLQKKQGFDLTPYKGKIVEIYTYKIKNYPGHEGEDGIRCNLMVYDGQLIGGDVCSTALDGFMQGLKMEKK